MMMSRKPGPCTWAVYCFNRARSSRLLRALLALTMAGLKPIRMKPISHSPTFLTACVMMSDEGKWR